MRTLFRLISIIVLTLKVLTAYFQNIYIYLNIQHLCTEFEFRYTWRDEYFTMWVVFDLLERALNGPIGQRYESDFFFARFLCKKSRVNARICGFMSPFRESWMTNADVEVRNVRSYDSCIVLFYELAYCIIQKYILLYADVYSELNENDLTFSYWSQMQNYSKINWIWYHKILFHNYWMDKAWNRLFFFCIEIYLYYIFNADTLLQALYMDWSLSYQLESNEWKSPILTYLYI